MSIDPPDLFSETHPVLNPLPCDRWIARSCLQKAIRRGDHKTAVRALANLFLHDPTAIWRHLTIVALEDVGIANLDILRAVVGEKQKYTGRRPTGLLWATFVNLADKMAMSNHDQTACDLLLSVKNNLSAGDQSIVNALPETWAAVLYDRNTSLRSKATAALCFGAVLDVPVSPDPGAVFEILLESSLSPNVTCLSHAAWRVSRNPMALLLPIVWDAWCAKSECEVRDDVLTAKAWIDEVPSYAFDQFTRSGKWAIRDLVLQDSGLQTVLRNARVPREVWTKVACDLVFLVEGGQCVNRTIWKDGQSLRRPERWLSATSLLGEHLENAKMCIAAKAPELFQLRQQHFHRFT